MERQILYTTTSKVWKLLVDEVNQLLFIETRDEDEREVTFSAIDLHTNSVLWQDYMLEEPWWLSMQYAINGILLITEFADSQNPEAKKLIAIDSIHGEGLWEHPLLFEAANQSVVLAKNQEQEWLSIDLHQGTLHEIESTASQQFDTDSSQLQFPYRYLPETAYFQTVQEFLIKKSNAVPVLAIDYAETTQHFLISFYEQKGIRYQQKLLVFSKKGELLFETVLDDELQGIGNEPFFIVEDLLIYVKDKSIVAVIRLSECDEKAN